MRILLKLLLGNTALGWLIVLAIAIRILGRVVTIVVARVTAMVFGKLPRRWQMPLTVVTLTSAVWLLVTFALIFPSLVVRLQTVAPPLNGLDVPRIHASLLAAVVLLPLLAGAALRFFPNSVPLRTDAGVVRVVLDGYRVTVGMAVVLVTLLGLAPGRLLRRIRRRWTSQHVPMVVVGDAYAEVIGDLQRALAEGGMVTERRRAGWGQSFPPQTLATLVGLPFTQLVPGDLTCLVSSDMEAVLYPFDLVLSGRRMAVARAWALLTKGLPFANAFTTWDPGAQRIEARLSALWSELRGAPFDGKTTSVAEQLRSIQRDLETMALPYEEWERLFRESLQVECRLLQAASARARSAGQNI